MSEGPAAALYRPSRAMAIWWIAAGIAGGIVSFLLYHEYIAQLRGDTPLISCSISPVVTCGPNLLSPGGNLLGFALLGSATAQNQALTAQLPAMLG